MHLDFFDKHATRHSPASGSGAAKRKAERRILVVDDNRDAALTLAMLLRGRGYPSVAVAHDGQSALKIAREQGPDVVFIDLVMPDMDGFELARRLRWLDEHEMRLIALTGFPDDIFVRYAKDAKFDGLVAKPASADELERVLEAQPR